ncbi:MAG: C4-dicarboxylate ABC transporter substrate-binding protein, partial [Pseudomonadota bacterium]
RGWAASKEETTTKTAMLAENGITVSEPSDVLRAKLEAVGATMTAEWLERAGDDGKAVIDAFKQ